MCEIDYPEELKLGYPPALAKACQDPFDYGMQLITGEVFFFESAFAIDANWVRITGIHGVPGPIAAAGEYVNHCVNFERGLCVRIDKIVWVADAPGGS